MSGIAHHACRHCTESVSSHPTSHHDSTTLDHRSTKRVEVLSRNRPCSGRDDRFLAPLVFRQVGPGAFQLTCQVPAPIRLGFKTRFTTLVPSHLLSFLQNAAPAGMQKTNIHIVSENGTAKLEESFGSCFRGAVPAGWTMP
eukprot:914910-Rhodomonas_salina.1